MPATLDGLDGLLAALRRTEIELGELKAVNKDSAQIVLGTAKAEANRASGALIKSGRASGTKKAGVVRFGSAKVRHAGPAHFGDFDREQGGFIRPNPFLYDAIDRRADDVVRRYEQFVERTIAAF